MLEVKLRLEIVIERYIVNGEYKYQEHYVVSR
jgi:hypothetical protein